MIKKCINVFTLLILLIVFFLICNCIPSISDDILYKYIYPSQPIANTPWGIDVTKPISDYNDVIISQWNHYFRQGGRTPVHIFVQLFSALWGKTLFSICNSFLFLTFIWYLGKNCFENVSFNDSMVFFIPFIIFFSFIIEPDCLYSTIAGAINYLWAPLACLMFLYYINTDLSSSVSIVALGVLSLFAGWSHEGIVIPIGIAVFVYLIRNWNHLAKYKIISIFLFFVGAALLIFAPGNFARRGTGLSLKSVVLFFFYIRAFYLYLIVLGILYYKYGHKYVFRLIRDNIYLNIGILVSLPVFAILGNGTFRSGYGIDLMSVILIGRLLPNFFSIAFLKKVGAPVAFLTISFFSIICYYQHKSSEQIAFVKKNLANSKDTEVVINLKDYDYVPYYLERYVITINSTEMLYEPWIFSVFEMEYNKKITIQK